jgi:hypothetical protein
MADLQMAQGAAYSPDNIEIGGGFNPGQYNNMELLQRLIAAQQNPQPRVPVNTVQPPMGMMPQQQQPQSAAPALAALFARNGMADPRGAMANQAAFGAMMNPGGGGMARGADAYALAQAQQLKEQAAQQELYKQQQLKLFDYNLKKQDDMELVANDIKLTSEEIARSAKLNIPTADIQGLMKEYAGIKTASMDKDKNPGTIDAAKAVIQKASQYGTDAQNFFIKKFQTVLSKGLSTPETEAYSEMTKANVDGDRAARIAFGYGTANDKKIAQEEVIAYKQRIAREIESQKEIAVITNPDVMRARERQQQIGPLTTAAMALQTDRAKQTGENVPGVPMPGGNWGGGVAPRVPAAANPTVPAVTPQVPGPNVVARPANGGTPAATTPVVAQEGELIKGWKLGNPRTPLNSMTRNGTANQKYYDDSIVPKAEVATENLREAAMLQKLVTERPDLWGKITNNKTLNLITKLASDKEKQDDRGEWIRVLTTNGVDEKIANQIANSVSVLAKNAKAGMPAKTVDSNVEAKAAVEPLGSITTTPETFLRSMMVTSYQAKSNQMRKEAWDEYAMAHNNNIGAYSQSEFDTQFNNNISRKLWSGFEADYQKQLSLLQTKTGSKQEKKSEWKLVK